MKEKTFKDLGLDEGDKYLNEISTEYDLEEFNNILNNRESQEELNKKMKEIKDEI